MTGADELPVLRAGAGTGIAGALEPAVLRTLAPSALTRFLGAQRWFGAKAHQPTGAEIADVVPVRWDGDAAALVRVDVRFGDHPPASYQLPLVVREREMSGAHAPRALLAAVEAGGVRGVLFDALDDPAFRREIAAALARPGGTSFGEEARARWTLEPIAAGAAEAAALPSRVSGGEQSNTSVIYGDRAMLKLFRKLEPGENPDVEITRFLTTRTSFRHTPELLGVLRFQGADGMASVSGMMSRYLPGAADGWTYALDRVRAYVAAPAGAARESDHPFVRDAARLGAITRELHEALASDPSVPGFAITHADAGTVDRWVDGARRALDDALDLLDARSGALPGPLVAMSRAIVARRAALHDRLEEIVVGARAAGPGTIESRHHGDYHLGQVLRTADGDWMVIDFEGEPARALAARRAPSSPRRDVAGMLRSFAYAAATAAANADATAGGRSGSAAREGGAAHAAGEIRAAHWERDARRAFLDAYGAPADDPIVALFEVEKMFYELAYELHHRPDWVWIPERSIARLL